MKLTPGVIVGLNAICVLVAGVPAGPGIAVSLIVPTVAVGAFASLGCAVAVRAQSRVVTVAERIEGVSGECLRVIIDPPVHFVAQIGSFRWR